MVIGSQRLRAKLDDEADGVIFALPAGQAIYTISFDIGPRFPAIERIVAKAGRAAGLPNIHSALPTVFDRLDRICSLPSYVPLSREDEILVALTTKAVPFIRQLRTVGAATEYALTHQLAFGHHWMRVPVMLVKEGRRREADDYFDRVRRDVSNLDFFERYRQALAALL